MDNHPSKSSLKCRNRRVQFGRVTMRLSCFLLTSSDHWNREAACYSLHINIIVTINGILGSTNALEKNNRRILTDILPTHDHLILLFALWSTRCSLSHTEMIIQENCNAGASIQIPNRWRNKVQYNTPRSFYFTMVKSDNNSATMALSASCSYV